MGEERQARHRISAEAEEQGVPQRDHAGIAHEQIEAHGEDGPDGNLAEPVFAGITREPPRGESSDKECSGDERTPPVGAARHAMCRAGSSPCGRSTSTTAISA